jgi:hypothetical protein
LAASFPLRGGIGPARCDWWENRQSGDERMKNLKIEVYKSRSETKPEVTVTIPFGAINVAMHLMPKRLRTLLDREGIDITKCKELVREQKVTGTIIEFEIPGECMVISSE